MVTDKLSEFETSRYIDTSVILSSSETYKYILAVIKTLRDSIKQKTSRGGSRQC